MSSIKTHLLTPGPVPLPDSILKSLSDPIIHHRTPEFTKILCRVLQQLSPLFQTKQPVLLLPSTGSGAMEAALTNTLSPGDEILIINSGKFGERWGQIAESFGIITHELKVDWGKSVSIDQIDSFLDKTSNIKALCIQACETSTAVDHPIQDIAKITQKKGVLLIVDAITALLYHKLSVDDGIDVLIAGSQKSFMLPAGLSLICLSPKAWELTQYSKCPKFYFNLENELKANQSGQTRFSSLVTHIRSLEKVLNLIDEEGLENYQRRAQNIQMALISGCKDYHLKIFSTCQTLTALWLPEPINGEHLRNQLEKNHRVTVAGGQDQLKGRILRIGHMGHILSSDIKSFFKALAIELSAQDFKITDLQIESALKKVDEVMR